MQIYPVKTLTHFNIIPHLCLSVPSVLIHLGFQIMILYESVISSMRTALTA
jgi:hypothetical protein